LGLLQWNLIKLYEFIMSLKSTNDLNRHIRQIEGAVQHAILRVVDSGWFVLGAEVKAFEEEYATYCGSGYCVSLANGTDALELALRALNIGQNNIVLTVANAGMYSTAAIHATGAKAVYADVSDERALIDVEDVAHLISEHKIDALIVTHLYGLMAGIGEIVQLAKRENIPVIEDCAQAHGAMRDGKKAGSFGDIGCFSFYPTKNLGALGDGGAVVTDNLYLAERVRQLRQYGWESKYCVTLPGGRNSRLDEIQAAVLRVKLPLLDNWNVRRREIAARYSTGIHNPKVIVPAVRGEDYVAHLYVINTPGRDGLKQHLAAKSIPSDVHYPIPDYHQPACSHLYPGVSKPVTERQCNEVLTLPCFPELTDAEVDIIIRCINEW